MRPEKSAKGRPFIIMLVQRASLSAPEPAVCGLWAVGGGRHTSRSDLGASVVAYL